MSVITLPYTVVGYYPEEGDSYVEWTEAVTPEEAVEAAHEIDPARYDAVVVAVFEGHMVCKKDADDFKGLSSV